MKYLLPPSTKKVNDTSHSDSKQEFVNSLRNQLYQNEKENNAYKYLYLTEYKATATQRRPHPNVVFALLNASESIRFIPAHAI